MQTLTAIARTTGLLYLGLAVTGGLGFLLVRRGVSAPHDPARTLTQLVENEALARVGLVLELLVVLTQALAAVWFYRLFRSAVPVAAGSIAAFGLVNAVAILGSAALLGTALEVARQPFGDAASTVQVLYLVSGNLWSAGALFFGLWLIPMGWCVLRSGWMPRPLGWILIGGGIGYVLSALIGYLAPDARIIADALTYPATVGELWMVGYLLVRGVRRTASPALSDAPERTIPAAATTSQRQPSSGAR